jgi:hypothetical protein
MTDQLVKDNERIDDLQNGYYVIQDPDKILLNSETMLETSGVSGDAVYFYFRADAVSGDTARLTLTNTNGDNLPITVTLTAP